jgi:hypothetical protein
MTSRRPLVVVAGQARQLPAGDVIDSDALPAHSHAAGDVTSGILAPLRGGTGVAVQPAFWLGRSATQWAISNNTFTIVPWDNIPVQTVANLWSGGHIVPTVGNWKFMISVGMNPFTPVAGKYIQIAIYKNGAFFFSPPALYPPAFNNYYGQSVSFAVFSLNGTDYYDVYVRQNMGATIYGYGDASYMLTSWQGIRTGV